LNSKKVVKMIQNTLIANRNALTNKADSIEIFRKYLYLRIMEI